MNTKQLWGWVVIMLISLPLSAQKIGYTNLELVLAYLPETQSVQQQLQTYSQQLSKRLETRKAYFDTKYQEYAELAQQPGASQEAMAPMQEELQKLQAEVQREAAKAEQQLAQRQGELMKPILDKLETEMKAIAAEDGYSYILNSSASGTSVILHAAEADDLSKRLLSRMGVTIDE
ncbi:MAG: OmpH family outer membrane protein [Bacteroidia bacterium]